MSLLSSTDTGSNFDVATDVDLAAMVDIGWELEPDLSFAASSLSPSGVSLQWNTVSFKQYAVERSNDLPGSLILFIQLGTEERVDAALLPLTLLRYPPPHPSPYSKRR